MTCAKYCSVHFVASDVRAKWNFHRIGIAKESRWWNGPRIKFKTYVRLWLFFMDFKKSNLSLLNNVKPIEARTKWPTIWRRHFRMYLLQIIILWCRVTHGRLVWPCWHSEAKTKWPPFSRRIFKCISLNENVWIALRISMKSVPMVPINNIVTLVSLNMLNDYTSSNHELLHTRCVIKRTANGFSCISITPPPPLGLMMLLSPVLCRSYVNNFW